MHALIEQLDHIVPAEMSGSVVRTEGVAAAVAGLPAPIGAQVAIHRQTGPPVRGEVIGFRDQLTVVYPLQEVTGIQYGNRVRLCRTSRYVPVGNAMLGRVVDAWGQPIDDRGHIHCTSQTPLDRAPPQATSRPRIDEPLSLGIRAIDGLLTCGRGQRMGVFSGSGVGKSVTLGMMAKYTSADVNVIALIGERGREVNEFIERDLGPEGLKKSVVVVATSDQPALLRLRAAMLAMSIAEYFRDDGKDVLLMMDSVTRFAMAQREIGLAAGEPPTTRGYPPSVFGLLPKLLERAGRNDRGSITALYTVLVEGDDTNEPISDAVRGLLDGHVVLSRKLAAAGHYPAIDVLQSVSRLATEICPDDYQQAMSRIRSLLAVYQDNEDLISIGAYRSGANPEIDLAIAMRAALNQYLQQGIKESTDLQASQAALRQLANQAAGQTPIQATASG